jgi:putative transposase
LRPRNGSRKPRWVIGRSTAKARQRIFNERTATPFNYLEYPTDIVLLVVLYRLRYKLSLRDVAEMFLEPGFELTHEAVRDWEARFAPLIADQLRVKRRGQGGLLACG